MIIRAVHYGHRGCATPTSRSLRLRGVRLSRHHQCPRGAQQQRRVPELGIGDDVSLAANALNDGMDGLYPVLNNYVDGEALSRLIARLGSGGTWLLYRLLTPRKAQIAATQLSLNPTMGAEALPGLTTGVHGSAHGCGHGREISSGVEDVVKGDLHRLSNPTSGFTTIAFNSRHRSARCTQWMAASYVGAH